MHVYITVLIPYEVAESKHKNADSSKLNNSSQIRIKRLHKLREHGRQSKGTKALSEGRQGCGGHGSELPEPAPVLSKCQLHKYIVSTKPGSTYQRIVRIC